MSNLSLGTIEVFGLPAAVEAADVACKTANVQLIGYETTDGMGMVAVKIEGSVSAVQAAVAAASAAAARVSKVFATSIIARPSEQLEPVVSTEATVGLAKRESEAAPTPAPEPIEAAPVEAVAAQGLGASVVTEKPIELPTPPHPRAVAPQTSGASTTRSSSAKK